MIYHDILYKKGDDRMYDKSCLNRINWENILSFIMYGVEDEEEKIFIMKSDLLEQINNYQQKCNEDIKKFANTIQKRKLEENELSELLIDELSEDLVIDHGKLEDTFLKFGLKIGFLLASQLSYL